ncbi:hypothetical protein MNEG_14056 [Monoraphidium neglectum]|uniref:Amino acid transporter transmembrane domain-containing protein n=1 Tax=Monoraphidium neglectum TaxID=145388 RepID=A0A0D2LWG9_9CHLO|nr:hypothetical protein MNEG_14056 [Monoraphidium neglectum]KIY93906.1 hypothetical protein MNEG_14056 [Monoraphidium neglectum]|eukprot:XP_013892926.1 hypothetical protein MNEG_14056 [Monoraphidium neglectum]
MRGVNAAFVITGILYFSVAISGFAALGHDTGSNIILSLSNGPMWVRNMARIFVVIHVLAAYQRIGVFVVILVLAAYQVYSHPVFDWIETFFGTKRGCTAFSYGSWASRLVLRTIYVGLVTLVAILIPFFTDLMALIGAVAITPTTFLLPPLLWLYVRKPRRFGFEWSINVLLVIVTGICGVLGAVSGMWLIVTHASQFRLLHN